MRFLTIAGLSAALLIAVSAPAGAQAKKNPRCNPDTCYEACVKRGGQVRLCGNYCEKRIREDASCNK